MAATIDQLIINAPYEEPTSHWRYERESRTFRLALCARMSEPVGGIEGNDVDRRVLRRH